MEICKFVMGLQLNEGEVETFVAGEPGPQLEKLSTVVLEVSEGIVMVAVIGRRETIVQWLTVSMKVDELPPQFDEQITTLFAPRRQIAANDAKVH